MADKYVNIIDGWGFIKGSTVSKEVRKDTSCGYVNSVNLDDVSTELDISSNGEESFALYKINDGLKSSFVFINEGSEGKTHSTIVGRIGGKESESYNPTSINTENLQANGSSYALLRTNPKLTGNIKVVVDSKSDMYLDTFKVNNALSKDRYRKIPISYKEYYGNNVMSVFRKTQSMDIFDVPQKYHSLFTVTNKFEEQFADIYRSGVSLNKDELYKENFSCLAPLRIGNNLPDFFIIFKVKNCPSQNLDSNETMKYMLENGKQIAFYDFREGSKLGTYIRTIQRNARNFSGEIYTTKKKDYDNITYGISLDKGVVSHVYESVMFDKSKNQVAYDNYQTKAYERHRLISPNIINFEFMFDDNDENQFAINTYFGMYVKENKIEEGIYSYDGGKGSKYIFHKDGKEIAQDSSVYTVEFDKDIIYGYTSNDWIRRITTDNKYNILDDTLRDSNSEYSVGKNIIETNLKKITEDDYSSYITIKFNETPSKGEHYRIACSASDENHKDAVYEIIISDDKSYKYRENGISWEIKNNYSHIYSRRGGSILTKNIIVNRMSLYVDKTMEKKDVIDRLYKAFNSFENAPFKALTRNEDSISIGEIKNSESGIESMHFERISSILVPSTNNTAKLLSYKNDGKKVTVFGDYEMPQVIINPSDKNSWIYNEDYSKYLMYNPMHFEILGSRIIYVSDFVKLGNSDIYEMVIENPSDDILYGQIYYMDDRYENPTPSEYEKFELSFLSQSEDLEKVSEEITNVNITSSFVNRNTYMIRIPKIEGSDIELDKFKAFKPYELSYSVFGFLSVKDFYFSVLDKQNSIKIAKNGEIDVNGEKIHKDSSVENIVNYINLDSSVFSFDSSFIKNEYNIGRRYSDISLTCPYNIKWNYRNTGIDGEKLKRLFFSDNNISNSTDNIKNDTKDILDLSIQINGKTARQGIIDGDIKISDIIYQDSSSSKESLNVYNIGNKYAEFIYRGLKIRISSNNTEILNIYDLSNFSAYVYQSSSCGNKTEWELFVDESSKSLLLVHYGIGNYDGDISTNRIKKYDSYNSKVVTDEATVRYCIVNEDIRPSDLYVDNGEVKIGKMMDFEKFPNSEFPITYIFNSKNYSFRCNISPSNDVKSILLKKSQIINLGNTEYKSTGVIIDYNAGYGIIPLHEYRNSLSQYIYYSNYYDYKAIYTYVRKQGPRYYYDGTKYGDTNSIVELNSEYTNYVIASNLTNCSLFVNEEPYRIDEITDVVLDKYIKKNDEFIIYAVTDGNTNMFLNPNSRTDFSDTRILVKSSEKAFEDYTASNVISMSVEGGMTVDGKLFHQSYYEPETIDILTFESGDSKTLNNGEFGNIRIYGVNPIEQMWITKYSELTNYCFAPNNVYVPSFDLIKDYNIMRNSFAKDFYKVYNKASSSEDYTDYSKNGYETGIITKTFFNSLALLLKNDNLDGIEINRWEGCYTDGRKIYFNITESLVSLIMNSADFNKIWNHLNISNTSAKLEFIKTSILPILKINTTNKIDVYYRKRMAGYAYSNVEIDSASLLKNSDVSLKNENGVYYVELNASEDKKGIYYIKYNIKL